MRPAVCETHSSSPSTVTPRVSSTPLVLVARPAIAARIVGDHVLAREAGQREQALRVARQRVEVEARELGLDARDVRRIAPTVRRARAAPPRSITHKRAPRIERGIERRQARRRHLAQHVRRRCRRARAGACRPACRSTRRRRARRRASARRRSRSRARPHPRRRPASEQHALVVAQRQARRRGPREVAAPSPSRSTTAIRRRPRPWSSHDVPSSDGLSTQASPL